MNVLRMGAEDTVMVTDGRGRVAKCTIVGSEDGRALARIEELQTHRRQRPELVLYLGAVKGRKVDDIVERLAQLGVAEVWVYESSRSVVSWDRAKLDGLCSRWRSIARSATKQSRSPYVLEVGAGLSWSQLVRRVAGESHAVALWEEASIPLRDGLAPQPDRVAIVVGPEGGFGQVEAKDLAGAGAEVVTLGQHILRTENAAVVAASAILFHYGLIG